ncbi:MAG TPA: class I SAM-dependent methyltransferase [Bryobacteraceae bacterium]|nr:class I SAM-dependent methyltransferase [Bryobacteraceae bacterium]
MMTPQGLAEWYQALAKTMLLPGALLDQFAIGLTGRAPLPPAPLRWRVHGTPDLASFLEVGDRCAQDIAKALRQVGRDFAEFRRILDFGCGCGRVLMPVRRLAPAAQCQGTDLDGEAIAWCAANLPGCEFTVNGPEPPLPFDAGRFDLVYAISVFTHLDEASQFRWLAELQRLTQPGGILLVTVHGSACWNGWPRDQSEAVRRKGILLVQEPVMEVFAPYCAQNTYHTREYVIEQYSRYFRVLDYLPAAMNRHQDVVLLERGASTAA